MDGLLSQKEEKGDVMKKGIVLILLILGSACVEEPSYWIRIEGLAKDDISYGKLEENGVEFYTGLTRWKGRHLPELLAPYNVNPEYVTFVSMQDHRITLPIQNLQNAYLCYEKNGIELMSGEGFIKLVIRDLPERLWVPNVKRIILISNEDVLVVHGKTEIFLVLTKEDLVQFQKRWVEAEHEGEPTVFKGVLLRTLLDQAGCEKDAAKVRLVGRDGYTVELDFAEVYNHNFLLVSEDFSLFMLGYGSEYWFEELKEIEVL